MGFLDKAEKPKNGPVVVTILADAGLGKTTLASTFPNPIFIRAENGLSAIPEEHRPFAMDVLQSTDDLWAQLGELITDDHPFKTLVIDSVTKLEVLFGEKVLADDPKRPKSLNQALGGFTAGYEAVGKMHRDVRVAAEELRERRGMNVVFIGHADLEKIDLPDADPYSRYSLRLHKKSISPYVDDVDVVAFIRQKVFVHGDGALKKATSSGARELVCYATASNISKNRFGITEALPFEPGENPLYNFIPSLRK